MLPDSIPIISDEEEYTITSSGKNECAFLNQYTERIFGRDSIPNHIAESWRRKNHKGFLCLKDSKGNIRAGLSIISFKDSFFDSFIDGKMTEADINENCLNTFEESEFSSNLYITYLCVINSEKEFSGKIAIMMLWGAMQFCKKYYSPKEDKHWSLYTMPINIDSGNMVERFKFSICSYSCNRRDNHNIYSLELTAENLDRVIRRIGDHSHICTVDF